MRNFLQGLWPKIRSRHTLPTDLGKFERKVFSQNGEDGIIREIFRAIPPTSKFFVEFGIGPHWQDPQYTRGIEGYCVLLEELGWKGLFMDGGDHPPQYGIRKEFVTPHNINDLLRKYRVPSDLDVISIDVDGQDWWIWKELQYRPTLVVIEFNGHKPADVAITVPLDPQFRWDGTDYFGASFLAMVKLGQEKGYTLTYTNGLNAFFVRSDRLANAADFDYADFYKPAAVHGPDPLNRPWVTV